MPSWFRVVAFVLFGLLFGSFGNVVIWRLPRKESLSSPGSHCPACEHPVRWFDNVPVVSWLVLHGKCRDCGAPIAVRYPVVEAASGVLFGLAAWRFEGIAQAVLAAALFWVLLVLSAIDLDHMRLPNPLVAAIAVSGLLAAAVSQVTSLGLAPLVGVSEHGLLSSPLASAALGALIGGGVPAAIGALYSAVRGRSGLGMGDVKLLGALGFFLGPYVLLVLFLGSVLGMLGGLVAARGGKLSEKKIPFGPWLALGAVLTVLYGPSLWAWYAGLAGLA